MAADRPGVAAPASESASGAFVGRERELGQLLGGLDDAFAGRGRLVLLVGEPGIGKSRLAEELARHARARGAHVLSAVAGRPVALLPTGRGCNPSGATSRSSMSRTCVPSLVAGGQLAELLPELARALPDLREPPALDPETARFRLFDAASSFLERAAAKRPIVLVLDDLHAADEPSLLLLQFVARGWATSRVLIVGAFRDVDPTLAIRWCPRSPSCRASR